MLLYVTALLPIIVYELVVKAMQMPAGVLPDHSPGIMAERTAGSITSNLQFLHRTRSHTRPDYQPYMPDHCKIREIRDVALFLRLPA